MLPTPPALAAALRATTPEVFRTPGACDALVIGAGAAGSLAALLLAEAGLRILLLDAGSANKPQRVDPQRQPIQSRCPVWRYAPRAFVDDVDNPYECPESQPFVWVRSRQLGGRMAVVGNGRQFYRLGPDDLAPSDGLSPRWPLRAGELDPWYAAVEPRLALVGGRDELPWLPDSELDRPAPPTPPEAMLQDAIAARWPGGRAVLSRFSRRRFDLLEPAARTGRLMVRQGAIVREIETDDQGRVTGAVWLDEQCASEERVRAPLVFLCASTLESTRLLLLSRSPAGGMGLGGASGALGRYLMDHVMMAAEGVGPALSGPPPPEGRCLYLPRFDARASASPPRPGRGFGVQLYRRPMSAKSSSFAATSFGEMLPRAENRVTLDADRRDAWGIRVLRIECGLGDLERARVADQAAALRDLAALAGTTLSRIDETPQPPGSAIHESGTARMGETPSDSVLDPHNQCWEARGLYVTDGSCFPSQSSQNPTLTILALTARACSHALAQLRVGQAAR